MHLENRTYGEGVSLVNGSLGIVLSYDPAAKQVTAQFGETRVAISRSRFDMKVCMLQRNIGGPPVSSLRRT